MAFLWYDQKLILTLAFIFTALRLTMAGDADIISDFLIPPNTTIVDANLFTHTALRATNGARALKSFKALSGTNDEAPKTFTVIKTSMAEFPVLNGQSVSNAVLNFPAGTVNPPHTHPRSAELLFLVDGSLEVGFVDTTNKLFTQTLQAGDMFVFPKGLIHYQYNMDSNNSAVALSAFGSANAGTVSVPVTLFNTSIDVGVLAKSFKTDVGTIKKIKAGFSPKA